MSVTINYKNNSLNKTSNNLVLFIDDKFNLNHLKKYISKLEFTYINDLLKVRDLKSNLFAFKLSSKKKIVLVSVKKNITSSDMENLGAEFYKTVNHGKKSEYFVNTDSLINKDKNFIGYFLHGLKLKSYEFKKYKSKNETRKILINISRL